MAELKPCPCCGSEDITHESIQGCGNHSCIIRKPKGQGTNSGCTCINRNMDTKEIRDVKGFIHWQSQQIADLKANLEACAARNASDVDTIATLKAQVEKQKAMLLDYVNWLGERDKQVAEKDRVIEVLAERLSEAYLGGMRNTQEEWIKWAEAKASQREATANDGNIKECCK